MKISSPHYFYGRSVGRLLIYNLVQKLQFFRRRGPSKALLKQTKEMKDSRKGKTALILGSGPSLNTLNPDVARNYFDDIFAVNNYYLHEVSKKLIPDFYCLSDPNYFVSDKTNAIHDDNGLFEFITEHEITLLLSHFYRKSWTDKRITTLFFDDREWRGFRSNISPLRPRSYGSFTLYKALATACYFGYDTIYVLGLDNTEFKSYIGSLDNKIYVDNLANYAKSEVQLTSTVSPEGFSSGIAGRMQSYALQFADLFLFKKHKIINLDPKSLVDAFEKSDSHPAINQRFA
jgi:hypothetical protein